MHKILKCLVLAVFVLLTANLSFAQMTYVGEVVDVLDAKTVVVSIPNGKLIIELQYIDVPVSNVKWRDFVKEHLRTLVFGKNVEYRPRLLLKERTIGRIVLDGVDISQQMLRDGAAWHVPADISGQDKEEFDQYALIETSAKTEKLGLWAFPELKPPWQTPVKDPVTVDADIPGPLPAPKSKPGKPSDNLK